MSVLYLSKLSPIKSHKPQGQMMFSNIRRDINTALERDPAAKSKLEVLVAYPGVHVLIFHRLAHFLWKKRFHALGRFISHLGRHFTGIEIHPGAVIGKGVFFDHGSGLVIGETVIIGDNVTLYQGVTLGGTILQSGTKRHPTLEEGVIVGAGAKILGPMTIGKNARIGSNSVVLDAIPAHSVAVGIPARVISPSKDPIKDFGKKPEEINFCAYGMETEGMQDPIGCSIEEICLEIIALRTRLEGLEGKKKKNAKS